MANEFIMGKPVSAEDAGSAFCLSTYIARSARTRAATGQRCYFKHLIGDLVAHGVELPVGAPKSLEDPAILWDAAEEAELVTDRKDGKRRFRRRAQLAVHWILALPKELTDQERRELVRLWIEEEYLPHGVAVEWAIHAPDKGSENWHAHLLVTTRTLGANGFGKKARSLNPDFARGKGGAVYMGHDETPNVRWRRRQEKYFRDIGLDLTVDPTQAAPGIHIGTARHVAGSHLSAANTDAFEAAQKKVRTPLGALDELTRRSSTFSERAVDNLLRRHEIVGEETAQLKQAILSHPDLLQLYDQDTGEKLDLFTTRTVRAQEKRIIADAERLRHLSLNDDERQKLKIALAAVLARLKSEGKKLDEEQLRAVEHIMAYAGLVVLQGVAGAGKSFTLKVVHDVYTLAGYQVGYHTPTNTTARAGKGDGFRVARTIHKELSLQDRDHPDRLIWDGKTLIIIDEAAMVDAAIYQKVMARAAEAGAKVVLVGDDRQLRPVERGAIYREVKARYGCAMLTEVRRQREEWQRQASIDLSEGRVAEAVQAYSENGAIVWTPTLDLAAGALVEQYGLDFERYRDDRAFAYVGLNRTVDVLNPALQERRWRNEPPAPMFAFSTVRGDVRLRAQDRLQFYANEPRFGIFNGVLGTVASVTEDEIVVHADSGEEVRFDPREFKGWGLGYCGTAFRGQGKTQERTYALYDNPFMWSARTAYVALTRHREATRLYVPIALARNEKVLVSQMSRFDPEHLSLAFDTLKERNAVHGVTRPPQPEGPGILSDIVEAARDGAEFLHKLFGGKLKSEIRPNLLDNPELMKAARDRFDDHQRRRKTKEAASPREAQVSAAAAGPTDSTLQQPPTPIAGDAAAGTPASAAASVPTATPTSAQTKGKAGRPPEASSKATTSPSVAGGSGEGAMVAALRAASMALSAGAIQTTKARTSASQAAVAAAGQQPLPVTSQAAGTAAAAASKLPNAAERRSTDGNSKSRGGSASTPSVAATAGSAAAIYEFERMAPADVKRRYRQACIMARKSSGKEALVAQKLKAHIEGVANRRGFALSGDEVAVHKKLHRFLDLETTDNFRLRDRSLTPAPGPVDCLPLLQQPAYHSATAQYLINQAHEDLDRWVLERIVASAQAFLAPDKREATHFAAKNLIDSIWFTAHFAGRSLHPDARLYELAQQGQPGRAWTKTQIVPPEPDEGKPGSPEAAVGSLGVDPDDPAACAVYFMKLLHLKGKRLPEYAHTAVTAMRQAGSRSVELAMALTLIEEAYFRRKLKPPRGLAAAIADAKKIVAIRTFVQLGLIAGVAPATMSTAMSGGSDLPLSGFRDALQNAQWLEHLPPVHRRCRRSARVSEHLLKALTTLPDQKLMQFSEGMRFAIELADEEEPARQYRTVRAAIEQVRAQRRAAEDNWNLSNAPPVPADASSISSSSESGASNHSRPPRSKPPRDREL